jgi:DNA-binding transcriptional LysR family regulator
LPSSSRFVTRQVVGDGLGGLTSVVQIGLTGVELRCLYVIQDEPDDPSMRRMNRGDFDHERRLAGDGSSVQSIVANATIDSVVHFSGQEDRVLLPHLEAFVEVARQGTVRQAGHVLHLGQPALSARIASLEQVIGVALFERSRKGMTLSPAGRAFLPHAERALAAVLAGFAHARDVDLAMTSELAIGAAPAVSAYVLPELIARVRHIRPDLRVLVRTGHSEEVVSLVAAGDVDVGLIRELRDARVVARPLFQEDLVLVVRPDHPFAYDERITVDRLRDSVLILFDRTSSYYDMTQALFRGVGVVPWATMEVDNIETAKRMTLRGLGVAFLPSTAVAESVAEGSLVRVRVVGVGSVQRRIVAVERLVGSSTVPVEVWKLLQAIPEFIPGAVRIALEE